MTALASVSRGRYQQTSLVDMSRQTQCDTTLGLVENYLSSFWFVLLPSLDSVKVFLIFLF